MMTSSQITEEVTQTRLWLQKVRFWKAIFKREVGVGWACWMVKSYFVTETSICGGASKLPYTGVGGVMARIQTE